ncbi:carboxypeptidase-like regulatory domain-containing protein [Bremerella sp. JC817]|uniref:carboxypeptidase-like regulatory domain-containing protein n=1 Tax=Bremerella sp. JC817 TaxID=3231756 RepID=UPI003457BF2B
MLIVGSLTGCSETPSYDMRPAKGVVQLDGNPIENANVVFHSETGPRAFGTTNANGEFELNTGDQGAGVATGDFLVKIVSTSDTKTSSGKAVSISPLYAENGVAVVTVSEGAENHFEFNLKSKPKRGDYLDDNSLAEP